MPEITDLDRALMALKEKQSPFNRFWAYYDGNAPVIYTASRLREIFGNLDATWRENWCKVVVDSVYERLNIAGVSLADDDAAAARLAELWSQTELDVDSDDVHLASLVCGESFVIAQKLDDQTGVEAYYNDPRLCWVYYDPERPKRKLYAAKWWLTEGRFRRVNLYYADRTEQYVSKSPEKSDAQEYKAAAFMPAGENIPNATGIVPVFHFRRERRAIKSELLDAIEIQNALNKLFSDMMVSSEYAAARQRYIVSNAESLGSFKGTDAVWNIPAGDRDQEPTQVGEFEAAELKRFIEAMDKLVSDLAVITRTPKHFFFGQSGDPSGESLIAMEAPLVAKCKNYIQRFEPIWRDLLAYLMLLDGAPVDPKAIEVQFDSPETVQPKARAETRESSVRAGIPLPIVLKRDEGWSEEEIAELESEREKDRRAALQERSAIANSLFDRGNTDARE